MSSIAVFLTICFCLLCPFLTHAQGSRYVYQEPISEVVNSRYDELHPVISQDGNLLFFTIRFHPKNIGGELDPGDIWISELKKNGQWSKPENAGELWNNSGYNILYRFFDSGQKALLLSQNEANKPTLAVSSLFDNNWTKPKTIKIQSFYNRSGHLSATISNDGQVLILSMESFNTLGYEDLYVSFRENDSVYSRPVSMGNILNTKFQEMTPHLSDDGLTLYFASNGHGGYGGRDIYASQRLDDTWLHWSEPANLGAGVNSQGIELSFYESSVHPFAYVSSTQNSRGMGDLFRMTITDAQLLASNNDSPRIVRPSQAETVIVSENKELEINVIEEAKVEIETAKEIITVAATNEEKREVFTGQTLSIPKNAIQSQNSSTLNNSSRNLSAVSIDKVSSKFSGRVLNANSNEALVASIKFDNNDEIITNSDGDFELLIKSSQSLKGWITADGMKPLSIEIGANQSFAEYKLSEIGSLSLLTNINQLTNLPSSQLVFQTQIDAVTLRNSQRLKWEIKDEESKEELEISWQWTVGNTSKEKGITSTDGVIILAGNDIISSRIILEAPGYASQTITVANNLLDEQIIYLKKASAGTSKLRNMNFIVSISKPILDGRKIAEFNTNTVPKQPYTINTMDTKGLKLSNVKVSDVEIGEEPIAFSISEGLVSFSLPIAEKPKKLKVISSGYFPQTIQAIDWDAGNHIDLNLEKIEIGAEFILSTLEFEQSTISFTDSTVIEELDRLADMLLTTAGLEIQLTGYTDNQGLARENMDLSSERAMAVKNYLISKGIATSRIEARGLGSANPIASNQSPETRKLNRRVEVTIVKIEE